MPNNLDLAEANIVINQMLEERWVRNPALLAMTKDYTARFRNARHTRDVWNMQNPELHSVLITDYYATLGNPSQPSNHTKDFTLNNVQYDRLKWSMLELHGVPGNYITDDMANAQRKLADFFNIKVADGLTGLCDYSAATDKSTLLYKSGSHPTSLSVTRAVLAGDPGADAYKTFARGYLNQFVDARIRAEQMPTLITSARSGLNLGAMPAEGRYAIVNIEGDAIVRRSILFGGDTNAWFGGSIERDALTGRDLPVLQGWKVLALPEVVGFSTDGVAADTSGTGAAARSFPIIFVNTSNLPLVSARLPLPTVWDRDPDNQWVMRATLGSFWMVESIDDGLVQERMFHSYVNVTG